MVKISFQAVSGQKVEKETDGDKSEILIPHPLVSEPASGLFFWFSSPPLVVVIPVCVRACA